MILSLMRFCGFVWKHNPLELKIEHKKSIAMTFLPEKGELFQDRGRKCTVISGKGELVGVDALDRYNRLKKLFEEGRKGVLTIPGILPVYAGFTHLSIAGETTPDLVIYHFEFTESDSFETSYHKAEEHIVKEGETLFDIAYSEGVEVDKLVKLNPQVMRPDSLTSGEKVLLC